MRKPCLLAIILICCIAVAAQPAPARQTITITALKPSGGCHQLRAQFLTQSTLLVSNPICTKGGVEISHQHAVVDINGTIRTFIELGSGSRYAYIGPPGYIFFPADHNGWLIYSNSLEPRGSLPVPPKEFPGGMVLSPLRKAVALSSDTPGQYTTEHWQLLSGDPLAKSGDYSGPYPFPGITDDGTVAPTPTSQANATKLVPTEGELWSFDADHHFTRQQQDGTRTTLPGAEWLAPTSRETWCSATMSQAQLPRILARCMTDVFLPNGFALIMHTLVKVRERFVVYDAAGNMLFKGDFPFDSPPSLSPDGHLLAVTRGKFIDIYTLP